MLRLARRDVIVTLAAMTLPIAAQAQASLRMVVKDGRVRAAVAGAMKTSVFLTVANSTDDDDTLIGVSSAWAERAAFVRTVWKGLDANTVEIDEIPVRAHRAVKFTAGHDEIMLFRPTRALTPGLKVPLELRFKTMGALEADVEVFNRLL